MMNKKRKVASVPQIVNNLLEISSSAYQKYGVAAL